MYYKREKRACRNTKDKHVYEQYMNKNRNIEYMFNIHDVFHLTNFYNYISIYSDMLQGCMDRINLQIFSDDICFGRIEYQLNKTYYILSSLFYKYLALAISNIFQQSIFNKTPL